MAADPGQVLREGIRFVLVRPQQSGNVGTVARAMKNMGLRDLAVVAPVAFDVDKARWMAPGAAAILDEARYVSTVAEAVADCRRVFATTARGRHDQWPAHTTRTFAEPIFDGDGRSAILFGPEDRGLANEDLVHAHALLHIPTDVHASLNLGQAALLVAAALFEEAHRRGHIPRPDGEGKRGGPARGAAPGATHPRKVVDAGELDPLVGDWMTTLELGTYLKGHEPELVTGTLRRILARAELDPQEVIILRGMLRKMRWKMRNPE